MNFSFGNYSLLDIICICDRWLGSFVRISASLWHRSQMRSLLAVHMRCPGCTQVPWLLSISRLARKSELLLPEREDLLPEVWETQRVEAASAIFVFVFDRREATS